VAHTDLVADLIERRKTERNARLFKIASMRSGSRFEASRFE
jgi:hypothetical protein